MRVVKANVITQRILIVIISIAIIISSGVNLEMVFGETVPKYDSSKAVKYAEEHYDDPGTTTTLSKQDCTQFLRECLEAGGVPKDTSRVNNGVPYGYTVEDYMSYLIDNGYSEKYPLSTVEMNFTSGPQWYVNAEENKDVLSEGDGIAYYCTVCKKYVHMSINTGVDKDGYVLYHAQNKEVGGKRLCLIDCSNCKSTRENMRLYSLHITSSGNGYSTNYNGKTVSNFKVRRTGDNTLSLSWDNLSGASGYKVFIKNGAKSAFNSIYDVKENSITHVETVAGSSYYFAVRPYFNVSGKTYVGKLSNTVYNNEYLVPPKNVTATFDAATGKVKITWDKSPGANGYEVYRSTKKDGPYTKVYENTGTSFNTSNLVEGTTYYFKIKAINKSNPAGNSALSDAASITYGAIDSSINRLYGATRYDTAFAAANMLLKVQEKDAFDTIIVACGAGYADALTGSYLAKKKNAPIILVDKSVAGEKRVKEYILKNLKSDGTVYILGGTGVVTDRFKNSLSGIKVKRLAGKSRYDTNISILKEAGVADSDILVCTGEDFADSLSASAVGKPIFLVPKAGLNEVQREYLKTINIKDVYLIGGTGVVSESTKKAFKSYDENGVVDRVSGSNRYLTSVAVAQKFFKTESKSAVLAYALNYPDGLSGGPLAMSLEAPLLLVDNNGYKDAMVFADKAGINKGVVLGGPTLISNKVANAIIH